jgi:hypothetical protein
VAALALTFVSIFLMRMALRPFEKVGLH